MANEDQPQTVSDEILEEDQVTLSPEAEAKDAEGAANTGGGDVAALEQQIADMKDQVLRTAAEMQNIRRRAEQDVEKARKFALEKFAKDMLLVADNLERAIEASKTDTASLESVVEGVELTLKTLVDGLGNHKVEQLDPVGEPFNPELHQAMTMVEQPDVEPNTVINVFQKGYSLNGRLIRPAMVVVSK